MNVLYNPELKELWAWKKFVHPELILSKKVTETTATIEKAVMSSIEEDEEDVDNSSPVVHHEIPSSSKHSSTGTFYCLGNVHPQLLTTPLSQRWLLPSLPQPILLSKHPSSNRTVMVVVGGMMRWRRVDKSDLCGGRGMGSCAIRQLWTQLVVNELRR